MRYRCFIFDEEERLDAGLRRLFAHFGESAGAGPARALPPARPQQPEALPAAPPCPCPAPRMW